MGLPEWIIQPLLYGGVAVALYLILLLVLATLSSAFRDIKRVLGFGPSERQWGYGVYYLDDAEAAEMSTSQPHLFNSAAEAVSYMTSLGIDADTLSEAAGKMASTLSRCPPGKKPYFAVWPHKESS